jgi:putative SOS response-associated peptidase YedK
MCFSARVQQDMRSLGRHFGAEIAWEMFAELFRRRLDDGGVKLSRGLERNFENPQSDIEQRIRDDIDAYRAQCRSKWQQEVFAQSRRLANAERALAAKDTKSARNEARVAKNKVDTHLAWLNDLKRTEPNEEDDRIFPMWFVPVIATIEGRRRILPMRYHCRLSGKPADVDRKFPGLYNARRDNLTGYWSNAYRKRHALMVVREFFENVPLHLYERRDLRPDEQPGNVVLRFTPRTGSPMLIACIWDRWAQPKEQELFSFAAITDEPPPEIAETGHQRCPISLREANVDEWLAPSTVSPMRLEEILTDKERPYYEHRIAA